MLNLVIEDDEGRRTTIPLSRDDISIGRASDNLIQLPEKNISRNHARIVRDSGRVYVEDRSRYGSKKNGRKFQGRTTFVSGDIILVGDYRLQLVAEAADVASGPTEETVRPDVSAPSGRMASSPSPGMPGASSTPSAAASSAAVSAAASLAGEELPPNRRSRLTCLTEPFVNAEFSIMASVIVIGRGDDCDVVVPHETISQQHVRVITSGTDVRFEDLGSPDGVLVNGTRKPQATLRGGDILEIGKLRFRFSPAGAPSPVAPTASAVPDDFAPPAARPAWILPAIIGGVVVLGVIAAVVLSPGADNSTDDVVTVVGDDASAAAFAQGQQYLSSARWSEAIESFSNVADTHPQYAQAQEQKSFAETELANQREYNEIQALAEASDFVAALQRLQALPRSSSYRSRASDDGLENRILNGLIEQRINESHEAQQAGDVDAARQMITDTLALKPDEPRLIARLDQLNNPGAVQEPIPEVVPEPVVQAEPAAVPPPSPERPPGEPAERPAAVAATPQSAAAQPAVAPADSNPRVNPVIVDDAPVAAAEPQGSPSEQSSDLVNRARRLSVDRNFAEAIRLLEEASALTPGNAQVYLMLFNNYQRIGNNLRAARSVRRYLELVPGDSRRAEFEEWLQANAP